VAFLGGKSAGGASVAGRGAGELDKRVSPAAPVNFLALGDVVVEIFDPGKRSLPKGHDLFENFLLPRAKIGAGERTGPCAQFMAAASILNCSPSFPTTLFLRLDNRRAAGYMSAQSDFPNEKIPRDQAERIRGGMVKASGSVEAR
jgi:hypothetical protein